MEINGIRPVSVTGLRPAEPKGDTDASEFQNILSDALGAVEQTDAADRASTEALLTGGVNNLSDAVIATEKADIALRLTVQIRNRVIDAYNEVMRMQV